MIDLSSGTEIVDEESGRIQVLLEEGHLFANSEGWQWRSHLVAMQILGRKLSEEEEVCHVNGEAWDDRPENLQIVVTRGHECFRVFVTDLACWQEDRGRYVKHEGYATLWAPRVMDIFCDINETTILEDSAA